MNFVVLEYDGKSNDIVNYGKIKLKPNYGYRNTNIYFIE